jgi:hypothetical protein
MVAVGVIWDKAKGGQAKNMEITMVRKKNGAGLRRASWGSERIKGVPGILRRATPCIGRGPAIC